MKQNACRKNGNYEKQTKKYDYIELVFHVFAAYHVHRDLAYILWTNVQFSVCTELCGKALRMKTIIWLNEVVTAMKDANVICICAN